MFADVAALDGVEVRSTRPGPVATTSASHPTSTPGPKRGRRGIAVEHRARQFTAADFDAFDVIVPMDRANRRDLLRLAPDDDARRKVRMLQVDGEDVEVPDPWGLPPSAYAEMFDLLDAACRELLADVGRTP